MKGGDKSGSLKSTNLYFYHLLGKRNAQSQFTAAFGDFFSTAATCTPAPPLHHPYITPIPSLHHPYTIPTPSLHHPYTIPTSPHCTTFAPAASSPFRASRAEQAGSAGWIPQGTRQCTIPHGQDTSVNQVNPALTCSHQPEVA